MEAAKLCNSVRKDSLFEHPFSYTPLPLPPLFPFGSSFRNSAVCRERKGKPGGERQKENGLTMPSRICTLLDLYLYILSYSWILEPSDTSIFSLEGGASASPIVLPARQLITRTRDSSKQWLGHPFNRCVEYKLPLANRWQRAASGTSSVMSKIGKIGWQTKRHRARPVNRLLFLQLKSELFFESLVRYLVFHTALKSIRGISLMIDIASLSKVLAGVCMYARRERYTI